MDKECTDLIDLWYEGEYQRVADAINAGWSPAKIAKFMLYFIRYVGMKDGEVLCKLL